jgi:hypothetical protein
MIEKGKQNKERINENKNKEKNKNREKGYTLECLLSSNLYYYIYTL